MTAINSGVSDVASSSSWNRDIRLSSSAYPHSSLHTAVSSPETPLRPAAFDPVSVSVGVATPAGRTAAGAADVPLLSSAAAALSRPRATATSSFPSPSDLGFVHGSVAGPQAKTAAGEGPAASAAASSSPLLAAAACRPASAAAASTAATTPAAAATPRVGAAGSRTHLLREEQQAAAAAASPASVVTPPAAEAAFFLHSADVVLLAKSFGHPLPSAQLSASRLAGGASSSFSTSSSSPGSVPLPLATPSYCQLTATAPSSWSPAAAAWPPSSEGVFSLIYNSFRWLLLQLLLLLASLYAPSFYPFSSSLPSSSSYLESVVLRICGWCSACFCALVSCCLRLFLFFPRLLRLASSASPPTPEQLPAVQGALSVALCSTDLVPCSTALGTSAASFYLIADGACSDQAQEVDGGGALLLTQLLPAVAAPDVAAVSSATTSRGSPQYLTSSSAVLYGHSPAAVILRNIGKTASLEAALGLSTYPPPTADTAAPGAATPAPLAAPAAAREGHAAAAAKPGASSLRLSLWQRLLGKRKSSRPSRYPTATVILRPAAGTSLLLVGYSDGRLETLQPSVAAAGNSNSGDNRYGFSDSAGCGRSSSNRISGTVGKSVWFAGAEIINDASFVGERSGDVFPSPPAEAAAAAGRDMQADLTAAGAGNTFPLWQLRGVERLQGPLVSLRASPCNTRICALTSRYVYIFEIFESQQQETAEGPCSSCNSTIPSWSSNGGKGSTYTSSKDAAGGCSGTRGSLCGCFYRSTRLSTLFAFGTEALYCCCRPLACCWTNSRQLLLLSSDGKLSVFCRDPRKTVGEWRCVTRLQLDAAARRALRSAMESSSSSSTRICNSSATEQLETRNGRSEESIRNGEVGRRSRSLTSSSNTARDTKEGMFASEDDSRTARGQVDAGGDRVRDVGMRCRRQMRKEGQQQRATTMRHSVDYETLSSASASSYSSSSLSPAAGTGAGLADTATAAAEEAWKGSFPVAELDYSPSLQLLYLSIRGHAVLLVMPWKTLYASALFPSSSSFFCASLSSPLYAAAAALRRRSARGWRGGAGGLLVSLRNRLLRRNEQMRAPVYEVDFFIPVWTQMQRLQKKQQEQHKHLLEQQAQRRRQQIPKDTAQQRLSGAAAATARDRDTEQRQRVAAQRDAATAAAESQQPNEEAVRGAGWLDADSATRRRSPLDVETNEKHLPEQQHSGDTHLLQTSAVGGILSFALTTEVTGASYVAVLHAGCSSVFVYDANFFDAGDLLLPENSLRNDQGAPLLPEEQQQLHAPVLRFCVPPPCAGCCPAALAFLSTPTKETPTISFFSPSPAAAAASATAAAACVLLVVRWVYPRVCRSEGEVRQAMLPTLTAFYSLPSVAAAEGTQQVDPLWFSTSSAAHSRQFLSSSAPTFPSLLSASLPPTSTAFRPLGAAARSASSASAAAVSAHVAAAEQETLDAWRTAARLGVPTNPAAVNAAVAGAAGGRRGSSSFWGDSSLTQKTACTGFTGCSGSGDFLSARGSNPQDTCGNFNNLPNAYSSGNACDPSRDSIFSSAWKEGFFSPMYPGLYGGEIGSKCWPAEGKANAQCENARATPVGVAPSTGIAEVTRRFAAAEDNLSSSRLSAWNTASPFLVDNSKYNAGRAPAASMQQADMLNSNWVPFGRSISSAPGASSYYDPLKKANVVGEQDALTADDFLLTQGETGWVQRWQLQQRKLMERWQLLQRTRQRVDQQPQQSVCQSDIEIPPALPSSFSRWTHSYPRVTVQRPAPYSFFHPYSNNVLSRLGSMQGSDCYEAVLLQQQRLSQQQQQPFAYRTRVLDSGELCDGPRWPALSTMSPGLLGSAARNGLIRETAAGGSALNFSARKDAAQRAFVDNGSFGSRQTHLNDDFSSAAAYRSAVDQSVSGPVLQRGSPAIDTRSHSWGQQQQLGGFARVPFQDCANVFTANTTNNVVQQTLPAVTSPTRLAAGINSLLDLTSSKGTDIGGITGQSYSDACYSSQRNPFAASALRLSNTSILQPFTTSTWTANYSSGPRTSIL